MSRPNNVLAIGASRNIGYYASIRFLEAGTTVTFLLRNPSCFDKDETIQRFIKSGQVHLVKGDALVQTDVQSAWNKALETGPVNLLLFTVGGTPSFHPLKGAIITPINLVTQSLSNALCTMPTTPTPPKIVAISSNGLTKSSHQALPFLIKPLYSYLLANPHADKLGAERLITHCTAGLSWDPQDAAEPGPDIMGSDDWKQREGLPAEGSLTDVVVIRPALLTDGECVADKNKKGKEPPYRTTDRDLHGYTVSRRDVAHFVVDVVVNRWEECRGKRISIAY